jgi:hypothetical protein
MTPIIKRGLLQGILLTIAMALIGCGSPRGPANVAPQSGSSQSGASQGEAGSAASNGTSTANTPEGLVNNVLEELKPTPDPDKLANLLLVPLKDPGSQALKNQCRQELSATLQTSPFEIGVAEVSRAERRKPSPAHKAMGQDDRVLTHITVAAHSPGDSAWHNVEGGIWTVQHKETWIITGFWLFTESPGESWQKIPPLTQDTFRCGYSGVDLDSVTIALP